MVRLSLLALSVATAFASVTSAAPYFDQQRFTKSDSNPLRCIHNGINEYNPFQLYSEGLHSFVSKKVDSSSVVGGIDGDKNLLHLQLCLVTTDNECTTEIITSCIYETKEYRFRVHGPSKGYLRVVGPFLRIVDSFDDASSFHLETELDPVVRVVHRNSNGALYDISALKAGRPIALEIPERIESRHLFTLHIPHDDTQKVVQTFNPKCISDLDVKEYESFKLKNIFLGTFVSKIDHDNMLVGDNPGDSTFHELEFCIVSTDGECNPGFRTDCIYEYVEYRIKVNGPVEGYLQADDDVVTIQPSFEDASALSLFKGKDGGLRIFQRSFEDEMLALAGLEPIVAYVWEQPEVDEKHQWFELTRTDKKGKCLQW